MSTPSRAPVLPVAVLGGSLLLAAFVGAMGLVQSKRADRYVTVKGVAERDVEADLVLWPLTLAVTDNDLGSAQRAVDAALVRVEAFLRDFGIDSAAVAAEALQVTDRAAERYGQMQPGQMRYIVSKTIRVRTPDLDAVGQATESLGRLTEAGVPLAAPDGFGQGRPTYVFTRLNDVKPEMIAEATASAREAAEQFAADSGSRLGGIRRANQGVFEILSQIPSAPEPFERYKRVRVVSTIEYYLDG